MPRLRAGCPRRAGRAVRRDQPRGRGPAAGVPVRAGEADVSDNSAIEWTDATWNPVTGCTEVSPGCDRCYAKTFAERWRGTPGHYFERGFDVVLRPNKLRLP